MSNYIVKQAYRRLQIFSKAQAIQEMDKIETVIKKTCKDNSLPI